MDQGLTQQEMEGLFFNIECGYLEGICRGFNAGLLSQSNYSNLTQCENLDDFRLQLQATDYGNLLANEASPISTFTIAEKLKEKLIADFQYLRANSNHPVAAFLDYLTYISCLI